MATESAMQRSLRVQREFEEIERNRKCEACGSILMQHMNPHAKYRAIIPKCYRCMECGNLQIEGGIYETRIQAGPRD